MSNNLATIYHRVSTMGQFENNSLESQKEACTLYCEALNLVVFDEILEVESGADWRRPGLDKLREDIAQGVTHVVVYQEDRLGRGAIDAALLEEELRSLGVTIHYVGEGGVAGNSPDEWLMRHIRRGLAEAERRRIRERTQRGRLQKAKQGRYVGNGPAPYGYIRKGEKRDVKLEVEPTEAKTVRQIFEWCAIEGVSVSEIARRLTASGVPTPWDKRGITIARQQELGQKRIAAGKKLQKNLRKTSDGVWSDSGVREILSQPAYTGTAYANRVRCIGKKETPRPQEEWLGSPVDPIISQELFDAAQARLVTGNGRSSRNRGANEYLLAGVMRCECGNVIHSKPTYSKLKGSADNKIYLYYVCGGKNNRKWIHKSDCILQRLRAESLDALVWDWLVESMLDHHQLEAELRRQRDTAADQRAKLDHERTALLKQDNALQEQQRRLVKLYLVGQFDDQILAEQKQDLESQRMQIKTRLAELHRQAQQHVSQEDVETIKQLASELRQKAVRADFAAKRRIVELLDVKVTLRQAGIEVVVDVESAINTALLSVTNTDLTASDSGKR